MAGDLARARALITSDVLPAAVRNALGRDPFPKLG
jgi:hypothetical protein